MGTVEIILTVGYSMLSIMYIHVFLYQRTIRKVRMKLNLAKRVEQMMYPTLYGYILLLSNIRYFLAIVLFFYNWWLALLCLVGGFVISIIVPEQSDYKNLRKALKQIDKNVGQGDDEAQCAKIGIEDIIKENYDLYKPSKKY